MRKSGISLPPGRGEGMEDRYAYLDNNGNPQEVQICFQWNKPGTLCWRVPIQATAVAFEGHSAIANSAALVNPIAALGMASHALSVTLEARNRANSLQKEFNHRFPGQSRALETELTLAAERADRLGLYPDADVHQAVLDSSAP